MATLKAKVIARANPSCSLGYKKNQGDFPFKSRNVGDCDVLENIREDVFVGQTFTASEETGAGVPRDHSFLDQLRIDFNHWLVVQ